MEEYMKSLNLRSEATRLVTELPEKYLPTVIGLMKNLGEVPADAPPQPRAKIDFSKYMNKGERMFKSTEEIDAYIRESRG